MLRPRIGLPQWAVTIRYAGGLNHAAGGDPAGELMLTILGAIGKFVRQNIIQNAILGKVKRAETGRYTGGRVPFGFEVGDAGQYVPDTRPWWNGRSAAEVAKMIYEMYIKVSSQGRGCLKVARELNALGVPGFKSAWGASAVYQLLVNPCYAGDFAYNKRSHQLNKRSVGHSPDEWVIVRDAHEPIVDRQTWETVQQLLKAKGNGGGRPANDAFKDLITGFLCCGECGAALTPKRPNSSQRYLYYTCCSRYNYSRIRKETVCTDFPYLRGDELEELIWGGLIAAATDASRIAEIRDRMNVKAGPDLAEFEAEIKRQDKRLASLEQQQMTLTTAFSEGKLPEHIWQKQIERLEKEREAAIARRVEAQSQVAEFQSQVVIPAGDAEIQAYLKETLLERATLEERREALALLVGPKGIKVHRDGRVDFDIRIPTSIAARPATVKPHVPTGWMVLR